MKTIVPSVALLCSAMIMLNSCSVSKSSVPSTNNESGKANDATLTCFVVKTDGSRQEFSTLRLVTGVLTTPHLLADNKTVIEGKDILAYQDNKRFAVSQKLLNTKRISYVATEALPGFATRIVNGKISVYSRKYYNGNTTSTEYFLQTGDDGEIVAYSDAKMSELLKDNQKAAEFFNSNVKISPKSKKMFATVDIYNNAPQFVTKN
jgi:hypothetical protein